MEKHTTWLAYLWAVICGLFAQWTLNDYGALTGIILGIGTFLVNRHYKHKAAQAQQEQAAAMEKRNRLLAKISLQLDRDAPDSTLKALMKTAEQPEGKADADQNED
ncbi:alpha/beta hydrolase [Salmonella enterica]|nr:alpha/beta hydrolase [Salmonella enterica]